MANMSWSRKEQLLAKQLGIMAKDKVYGDYSKARLGLSNGHQNKRQIRGNLLQMKERVSQG